MEKRFLVGRKGKCYKLASGDHLLQNICTELFGQFFARNSKSRPDHKFVVVVVETGSNTCPHADTPFPPNAPVTVLNCLCLSELKSVLQQQFPKLSASSSCCSCSCAQQIVGSCSPLSALHAGSVDSSECCRGRTTGARFCG